MAAPASYTRITAAPFVLSGQSIIRRRWLVCGVLAFTLVGCILVGVARGAVYLPESEVARLLLRGIGLPIGLDLSQADFTIIWTIRLPRVLVGGLVGAALATSGGTLQGLFRNPLADPGLLGISMGGSLGGVIAISSGLTALSLWILPGMAFLGAMGACGLIYGLAASRGRAEPMTLLLAGLAVSAFFGALISVFELLTRGYDALQEIVTWLIGGLNGRGWDYLGVGVLPVLAATLGTFAFSRDLNLLWAGEETAQSLGVNVSRIRLILLALTSLMTGAAVSIAGGIGFVGLMVPHTLRLIVGPDHRVLLPASALGGASFLILADTVTHVVLGSVELPAGIVTALLGAPFFLFLLWRRQQAVTGQF